MIKLISKAILVIAVLVGCYGYFWVLTISPCIKMYENLGFLGVGIYLLVEHIVLAIAWAFIYLVAWASDNLF